MINNMKLRNFKSIQNDEIEFKPLTILTGPNSSGKSNIIQPIALISQIAKKASTTALTFPQHLEQSDSEYFTYPKPSAEFLVYRGELERQISIEIHILSAISQREIGYLIRYTPDKLETEQMLFVKRRYMFYTTATESGTQVDSTFKHPMRWNGEKTQLHANLLLRPEAFMLPEPRIATKARGRRPAIDNRLRKNAESLTNELAQELGRIYLLSAPRGIIPINVEAGPDPTWVGRYGQDLIYILSRIFSRSKYRSIQQSISSWAEKFGIGNIAAGLKKGVFLGADFEDPIMKAAFDMISASYGSKQLLTVMTQIFWSKSGDTLLIEEPEISLHPESQVLIQELFARAVSDGKQIICTTHSPFFILSLSRVIGAKILPKDSIAVYHVEKGAEGTKARRLELNDRGFIEGWIPSYMEIENKLFNEWAESVG